ncbi:MAG TPA: DUF192 domain-containing protein [Actinomycetota bacterium]|nr:DUF192 domain-containing protein [Actinomycetota bacterium]
MRRGEVFAPRGQVFTVEVPETRAERARGLLGRDGLEPGTGMLFERASSVHTMRMRFPITVAYLSPAGADGRRTVRRVAVLRPGRMARPRWSVRSVLELPAGADVRAGDAILCRLSSAGSGPRAPIV